MLSPMQTGAALMLAAIVLTAGDAHAQKRKRKGPPITPDGQTMLNLQQHIGILASDSLEGRRVGTAGEAKAIEYISGYYKTLGIPASGNNYVQAFEINEGKTVTGTSWLKINNEPLALMDDYFPFAFGPATAKIDGTSAMALKEGGAPWWFDVHEAMEAGKNNPHFDLLQQIRTEAKNARSKGATALFVYDGTAKTDSLAFNAKDHFEPAALPVIYFTKQCIKKYGADATAMLHVTGDLQLADKSRTGHNVAAFIDNGAATTVVLGAHLDHLGYGEDHNSRYFGKPMIHNGADDNASGTAALLELARILKDKGLKNNNYCFVHFSGEELGLFGSKYFTEHATFDIGKTNYMINMDMVGRLSDTSNALTIGGVGTSPQWGNLLNMGTEAGFTFKVDSSGTGPSDHTSFYRKNIPVLFFFTGLHTDYHKPSDDAELINYRGEVKIINYITELVARANEQGKLAFTKTKEQSMGTGRFKVSIGIMPDYTFSGQGVRADGVIDNRPASKAGLQTGDVIVQLGEHLITGMETYMQALNRFEKGQSTTVTIKRGREVKEFPITF